MRKQMSIYGEHDKGQNDKRPNDKRPKDIWLKDKRLKDIRPKLPKGQKTKGHTVSNSCNKMHVFWPYVPYRPQCIQTSQSRYKGLKTALLCS